MALVNTKSTVITNADAGVLSDRKLARARVLSSIGFVIKAASDSNNSVFRFARLPSNAIIRSITVNSDAAITGGTAFQLAGYDTPTANSGVVIANLTSFGAALDLSTAGIKTVLPGAADVEKTLWQLLGLATDPGKSVDIALLATTSGSTAANISMDIHWVE
jgi:hypothetical protein